MYAQNHTDPCTEYRGQARRDCYYEFLLQRWYSGADGQKKAPVDSAIRQQLQEWRSWGFGEDSPEIRKQIGDLERYRGLGIFYYEPGVQYQYCFPLPNSIDDVIMRIDGIAMKMLKTFHRIDADTSIICTKIWSRTLMEHCFDQLIGVWGLPDDEAIVFLISGVTSEVLSTYRYKIKRE